MTSARQNPRQLRSAHSVHHPCTILLSLFHPISISITNIATTTTTPFHHHLVSISPFALSCSRSFHPALLAVAADPRFCQAPYPRLLLAFILAPRPFIPNLAPFFITISLLGLHVHNSLSLSLLSLRPALSFALISCHPPSARPLRPFILTSRDPSARIASSSHPCLSPSAPLPHRAIVCLDSNPPFPISSPTTRPHLRSNFTRTLIRAGTVCGFAEPTSLHIVATIAIRHPSALPVTRFLLRRRPNPGLDAAGLLV